MMIKTRIIGLLIAVTLTTGIVSVPHVAAQTVIEKPKVQSITLDQALYFCSKAYADFRKNKNTRYLDTGMKMLDPAVQKVVGLVCAGYGVGYEDGTKWIGNRT